MRYAKCLAGNNFKSRRATFLLLAISLLSVGCATTKVEQISSDFDPTKLERDEAKLWRQADRLEKEQNISLAEYDFFAVNNYLNEVLKRVNVDKVTTKGLQPRVRVTPDTRPIIFTLPNGATYISTGMLAFLENEAQLAFLLAHELGHFKLRHGLKQIRHYGNHRKLAGTFGIWLGFLTGGANIYNPDMAGVSADFWELLATASYEYDLELEADRFALASILTANYDLNSAKDTLMNSRELAYTTALYELVDPRDNAEDDPRVILLDDRIKVIEKELKQSAQTSTTIVRHERVYFNSVLSAIKFDALDNLSIGNARQASKGLENYLAVMPANATTHYLRGRIAAVTNPKNPYRALAWYQKSIAMDKDYADSILELGFTYREIGKADQAKIHFEKYLTLVPYSKESSVVRDILRET